MGKKLLFWVLIILFASGAFYVVCPKYYFQVIPTNEGGQLLRCNEITGTIEGRKNGTVGWSAIK